MAKTFAGSNETKEFRISCLSARRGSPVDTELSVSIGRGCNCNSFGDIFNRGKIGGLDGKELRG